MRTILVLALMLAATVGAGCLDCQQQLDIRHCIDGQAACPPAGTPVNSWTSAHTNRWPQVEELMRATPEGEHGHKPWSGDRDALLHDIGWAGGDADPEVFVRFGGDVYRIRVLVCDSDAPY